MKNTELLAPSGDWESLEAAVNFGADAIYLGGDTLQLRSAKAGFSRDDIGRAAELLHRRGKRLYVTVNSFARNGEIRLAGEYARFLRDAGADAAIISDIGVLAEFAQAAPELERHVSTQANCMNWRAAKVYAEMGAKRVVLAREMSLDEIKALRDNTPPELELEAFVHGAMCMAYSGRCIISSFLTGRSGNRGECTQPCRWSYSLVEEKRPGEYFPVEESDNGTAILSSHDLCCIEFLDKLRASGVSSFKIEGRMKTAYYVATAVNAYRKAIDGTDSIESCRAELDCIKHRPYSTGFYFGYLKDGHYNSGRYSQSCKFIGNVLGWENGIAKIRQRNNFKVGDVLEVLSPKQGIVSFTVNRIENEEGELQESAPHPNQIVFVPCEERIYPGDFLRRRESDEDA
ncbi:MAG: U32 family peptidase [Oscillospiraceae bacterium]